ncbi:DUF7513 family protein [Halorubrum lacusprofundi]|jgi:hypothetical protein|uniref:DUF7513 domain-containing protein n=1 Tax=Halorubrum lacusprofundi (strain ATCC 49239 / DSM 5036 / JCM 8891 / ACAM 34) TaxID=416348 RepID=B9LTT1_HALLT|nr:hypothetical protein [Halorubrum lacusprofundi]ACM56215.1 conserved hypothetical protein [Halorubrum lacusprofundi ATCC 49239]MCG1005476.1 hypothetical protein [Halorubrum lacusprofundi]
MSRFDKFFAGFSFRESTPDYEPGDVIEVMVTGTEGGDAVARIGDSMLRIEDAPADAVNTRVLVVVETWDEAGHRGTGTYRETVGKSAF